MKLTDRERNLLEDKLCRAEEKGAENREKALYEKAVQKDKTNMDYLNRAFPYITEEHLYDTITGLYPDLNEMFIVNLDERDSQNIPLVKTKNFRTIKIHHKTWKYRTGQIECDLDVKLKLLVAVIENGTVYIKSANLQNGHQNKRR